MRYIILILALSLCFQSCVKEPDFGTNVADRIYIRSAGADMPAYIYGNASSKVFMIIVHGGPGGNGLEYRGGIYTEELEKDYALVYWDQRGQGMSHGNYAPESVTVATMVEDLHVLVKTLKHRYGQDISLFMLGHSWGGMLGTAYMVSADYQNELKGWIESNGAHDIPLLNKEAIKMYINIGNQQVALGNSVEKWTEILQFANGVDTNNITMDDGGRINFYGFEAEGIIPEVTPGQGSGGGIMQYIFFSQTNPLTSSLSGNYTSGLLNDEVENKSLTDQLYKITRPTLLLWGSYDFVVPPALGVDAFNKISSSDKSFILFQHSGHSPMDNEPMPYVTAVRDFVNRNK